MDAESGKEEPSEKKSKGGLTDKKQSTDTAGS